MVPGIEPSPDKMLQVIVCVYVCVCVGGGGGGGGGIRENEGSVGHLSVLSQVWQTKMVFVLNDLFLLPSGRFRGGGVRGVQMHPPLAASNVFFRT